MPHDTTEPTRQYIVRTRKLERRWRAGLCFGLVAVEVALTAEHAQLVMADTELVCSEVPMPELALETVPAEPEVPAAATDGVKPKAKAGK